MHRDMGIFYTFVAACLAQRWVGFTFMSFGDHYSKKYNHSVNAYVHIVYTHSVNVCVHKDSENEKTPLRLRVKTFPPTQSCSIVICAVVMSERCRQGLCPQCWILYECRSKVVYLVGSNSSREKSLSCGQIQ